MKMTMKKILCTFLVVIMCLTASPLQGVTNLNFSIEASALTEGYYTYTVSDGKATITGVDYSISGDVTVPATLGGYPVTCIARNAYYSRHNITSITIGNNITTLEDGAIGSCENLISASISESVTDLGSYPFYNCPSLTNITVDENNKNYSNDEYGVLFSKYKSTLLTYPSGNQRTSYNIPNSVTSILTFAFEDAAHLKNISIPEDVISISDMTFRGCDSLTNITVDKNNKYYSSDDEGVLYNKNKTGLIQYPIGKQNTSYIIPDSVILIESDAFSGCLNLTNITIPENVLYISDSVFYGCKNLANITIPDNVVSISGSAFRDTAYYENEANWENGVLYIGNHLIDTNRKDLPSVYTIKAGTKTLASGAFFNCPTLTSITIPDSIKEIPLQCFGCCDNLKSVTIPDSVTRLGPLCFQACFSLENITIPDSVTFIGSEAFVGCKGLTTITIPDSVTYLGDKAFYNCENLADITISDNVKKLYSCSDAFYNTAYYNNSDNWENGTLYIGNHLFEVKSDGSGVYTIKNGTKTVASDAFKNCAKLTTVVIPLSVVDIPSTAFDWTKITDIYYFGSEKEWKSIFSNFGEDYSNTTFHFNCCPEYSDKEHVYSTQIINQPTHMKEGLKLLICECGYSYTEAIEKLKEHTYTAYDIINPDCVNGGYTVYVCECGDTYNGDFVSATGHSYDGDTCINCGKTKVDNCSCNCHKGGINGIIWKILNFFYKLFGMKKYCACGVTHY